MNYQEYIKNQINQNNPWYNSSQFEWAEKRSIKNIYYQRAQFFLKVIFKSLKGRKFLTLLDYGCGDGYWTLFFSRIPFCRVTGVDYNKLRLDRAKTIVKTARFLEADIRKKNNSFGQFDIIFCSQVIEHIKDDIQFLRNLKNHLKSNGRLILGTPNEGSLTHRIRSYYKGISTDHYHFYKENEIKTKLKMTGFQIETNFREIFYPGLDKIYYSLADTSFGFKILQFLTFIFPSQCSDYYFECKLK